MPTCTSKKLVEECFRHESGKLTAYLTRVLGVHQLGIAEEIVQETFLRALQVWPFHPPLDQPAAWLWRVAKNKALDHLRKIQRENQLTTQNSHFLPPLSHDHQGWGCETLDVPFTDELLCMMFLCCEESLSPRDQVALCLHLVGGLSSKETACAFMTTHPSMRKRLYRAKQALKTKNQAFILPPQNQLPQKLDHVLSVLYLMFNEGFFSHSATNLINQDLMNEALRLVGLLVKHSRFRLPKTLALGALMSFLAARSPGRISQEGNISLLESQDRRKWNQDLIKQGLSLMEKCRELSTTVTDLSSYHFEAAIAGLHCLSPSLEETDWREILRLYDHLTHFNESPLVALNRLIVLGQLEPPESVLHQLHALANQPDLEIHHYLYAVIGEFYSKAGNKTLARAYLDKAIHLSKSPPQSKLLLTKKEKILGTFSK